MENKGLIYERKIKDILTNRNLLPPSLAAKLVPTENDAGFVHNGKEFFLELKNISAPDYGARQIDYDAATKNWKWNKTDAMTLLFDRIGILQKAKAFIPRKFVKADHELTDADKRFDRTSFAHKVTEDELDLANLAMTGANVLHEILREKELLLYSNRRKRNLSFAERSGTTWRSAISSASCFPPAGKNARFGANF